ncbi:hypothetical protein ACOMHN_051058 [Nucella lapillus]
MSRSKPYKLYRSKFIGPSCTDGNKAHAQGQGQCSQRHLATTPTGSDAHHRQHTSDLQPGPGNNKKKTTMAALWGGGQECACNNLLAVKRTR